MLTSILRPVVHEGSRHSSRRTWLKLAAIHSAGLMISAVTVGIILSLAAWIAVRFGAAPSSWASWSIVLVALFYLPRQLRLTRFPPLLQSVRQVPQRWAFNRPTWVTALLFGLGLGSGVYTRIVVPTFYLLLILPVLFSRFFWPVVIWSSYGLARSLLVWWLACTATEHNLSARAYELVFALNRRNHLMHRVHAALLLAVAAWFVTWSQLK